MQHERAGHRGGIQAAAAVRRFVQKVVELHRVGLPRANGQRVAGQREAPLARIAAAETDRKFRVRGKARDAHVEGDLAYGLAAHACRAVAGEVESGGAALGCDGGLGHQMHRPGTAFDGDVPDGVGGIVRVAHTPFAHHYGPAVALVAGHEGGARRAAVCGRGDGGRAVRVQG